MSAFDQLQQASFAGYVFPVREMTVSCKLRDHVHVYPHAPGGQPEKLGRDLYEFKMTCPFHGTLPGYPKLWPETLASLRVIYEGGGSFDLVVPTIGTITAYCIGWSERMDAKHRSGVVAEFTFREDSSEMFLVTELIAARTAATFAARQTLQAVVTDYEIEESLLDQIIAAVTELERMKGRAEQEAYLISAKAASVVALCDRAASLPVFDIAPNYVVLDALREVQSATFALMRDAGQGKPLVEYTVPGPLPMPIGLVSMKLYGDTSHSLELMRLNAIPDPLAVLPGTTLRAYAPSA